MRRYPHTLRFHFWGFTLLEILASIVLFALLTLAIMSTMRQTTNITRKLKSHANTTLSSEVALERLQRELQMAFDENLQKSKTFFKAVEKGFSMELTFSYIDSELRQLTERRAPGIRVATYRLEKSDDKNFSKLLRADTPLALKDKITDAPLQVVADGVLNWKLEFYDGRNNSWKKEWDTERKDTTPQFPKAVKIEIETVDPAVPEAEWKNKSLKLQTAFMVLNEMENR